MDNTIERDLSEWLLGLLPDVRMDAEIIRQNRDALRRIARQPSWSDNAEGILPMKPIALRELINWLEELLLELPMDRDRIHTLHDQLIEISQRLYQQELAAGLVEEVEVAEPAIAEATIQ